MTGGEPRSPYAKGAGHTICDRPPFFIDWSASPQHGTAPKGNSGLLRLMELSKTVPSMSLPS